MATLDQDLKDLIDNAAEQQYLGAKSDHTATYQVAQLMSALGVQDIGNNIVDALGTMATKLDTINTTLASTNTKLDTANTTLTGIDTAVDTANTTLNTIATNTTPTA